MTELEAVEAANAIYANMAAFYTIFFAVVSGYLIVAYVVGKSLTRFQAGFVTTLFLFVAAPALAAFAAFFETGLHYTSIQLQMRDSELPITGIVASGSLMSFTVFVNFCFLLASLWFMWDIRHPKRQ